MSKKADVGIQTFKRFAAVDEVPPSRLATLLQVEATLEAAGIEFIGSPTDRPGIRLGAQARVSNTSKRRQRS